MSLISAGRTLASFPAAVRCASQNVVLLQDIDGVGVAGSETTVASGYMRNFLYPKGLAKYATKDNVAKFKTVFEVRSSWQPTIGDN